MRKSINYKLILIIVISVIGCRKHSDTNSFTNSPTNISVRAYKYIISGDTVIMGDNVIFVKNDINKNLIKVDTTTLTYFATGFQDTIKLGDILYKSPDSNVANGYARKIVNKTVLSGVVTFSTSEASITDVFKSLNESNTFSPVFNQEKVVFYDVDSFLNSNISTLPPTERTNAILKPPSRNVISRNLSMNSIDLSTIVGLYSPKIKNFRIQNSVLSFDYVLFDKDGDYSTTDDELILSLTIAKNDQSNIHNYIKGINFYSEGGFYLDATMALTKSYGKNFSFIDSYLRANLLNKRFPIVGIPLTPVSVTSLAVYPTLDVFVTLSLDIDGQLAVTGQIQHVGVNFNMNSDPLNRTYNLNASLDANKITSNFTIDAELNATLKAGIGVGMTASFPAFSYDEGKSSYIGIYGDVILNGNLNSSASASSTSADACYDIDLNSGIYGDIWMETKLGAWDIQLVDKTVNILDNYKITDLPEKKYSYCTNNIALPTWAQVPVLTTTNISSISSNSVSSGGNITSNSGNNVTSRGVCYSTINTLPTLADIITNDGTGSGIFTSNLGNLHAATNYYLRAYASNSNGTGYGNTITFSTLPAILPIVNITNSASNITNSTATSGGNITSDGGATISSRGICWSTSKSPTINDNKTSDGYGIGSFVSNISNLNSNTTYFVRAYATNSVGTSYGNEISFTTLNFSFVYQNGLGFGKDISGNSWNIWSANGSNVFDWQVNYLNGYLQYSFKVLTYSGFYCSGSCRYHNIWDKDPTLGFELSNVVHHNSTFPENNQDNNIYQVNVQWNATGYHVAVTNFANGVKYSDQDYSYQVNQNTYDSWTWGYSIWDINSGAYYQIDANTHASAWTSNIYMSAPTGENGGGGGELRTDALKVVK